MRDPPPHIQNRKEYKNVAVDMILPHFRSPVSCAVYEPGSEQALRRLIWPRWETFMTRSG